MEFDKNAFIDALQQHGNFAEAAQAQVDLPQIIDSATANEWLSAAGIDPAQILDGLPIAEGQEMLSNASEANPEDLMSNITEGGGIGEMISNLIGRFTGR